MQIAIIGAGFTGLTAALRLCQKGHQVTVFEKESAVGGLAAGFFPACRQAGKKDWAWSLENFYHHLFPDDEAAQKLITEIGLWEKLFYSKPKTSIFLKKKISQFDSMSSLLTFPQLSLLEKLRTGIMTFYLKTTPNWRKFEKVTASSWLIKFYGKRAYQILWEPLLKSKFGQEAPKIPLSWFWARIKKRNARLGYLEGGFQDLIKKLVEEIKKGGGKILLNHEIKHFNQLNWQGKKFDRLIFTTPSETLLKIFPNLPQNYKEKLNQLKMIGALNLILVLKEKFLTDNTYWLNINEKGFPFVAVVEHTNFVDPKYYGGNHILYVGGYYPQNHRYFQMTKEEIYHEFLPWLKKINPNSQLLITNYYLFKNQFAQPIMPVNYSQILPPHQTPIPKVYLANMQQVYPWDRGVNYAIELGEKIAKIINL